MFIQRIRFKVIELTLVLFMLMSIQSQAQTVNIFVHKWPSATSHFPSPATVNTAYSQFFTTVNTTTGLVPSVGNLNGFDVLVMCELTYSSTSSVMSNAQRGVVEAFVNNGGHVVWVAENSIPQNAPGSDQIFVALQNLWGINVSRVASSGFPCVPYHGGGGPGGLTVGVATIPTSTSYDFFTGSATLHQNCVLSVSGGQNSCTASAIKGMCYLFPEPYICGLGGTIISYGEVQMWSSARSTAIYQTHYRNVAALHHAIITGDVAAIDAINLAFAPNVLCTQPTACTVLPVEWGGFEVLEQGQNSAKLLWWTSQESQNHGFEIEHAIAVDGELNFNKAGWVEGAGNSELHQAYEFLLSSLAPGEHHFRIKSIDQNGQFFHSEVRSMEIQGSDSPRIFPTTWRNNQAQFQLVWPVNERLEFSILDLQGKQIAPLFSQEAFAGTNTVDLLQSNLPSGTYLLMVKGSDKRILEKVLVY